MAQKSALWLMAVYATLAFLFDLSQPLGIAAGVPYLGLPLIALALGSNRALYLAAAAASVLTVAKAGLLWGEEASASAAANRTLTVAAFWGVAAMLASYRNRAQRAEADKGKARLALAEREAELRRSHELRSIAAGLAHHFNNVLNAAIAITDMLPTEGSPTTIERLQEVHWRAANLVRELLAGFGDCGEEAIPVKVADLIADVGIRLSMELQISGSPETQVLSRGWGLADALEAVLLNAVESAPDGRINVRWSEETAPEDPRPCAWLASRPSEMQSTVWLSVEDDGAGMDAQTLARAGEPFFSTKGPHRLGLGLLRARTVLLLHGGGMALYSAPGQGTRVDVWLPTPLAQTESA